MRAFGWPGIDPPVLRFSASELTRSEGKAKTPAKSIRRVASQGPCRIRLGRRPEMRAALRKRTEVLEDRPNAGQPRPELRPIASPRVRHAAAGGRVRGRRLLPARQVGGEPRGGGNAPRAHKQDRA